MTDPVVTHALRELLEQRIAAERSLADHRFKAERERTDATYAALVQLLEQRFAMQAESLRLQAIEYERRLTALNHAHELAVKEQARVLPREMFDQFRNEYEKFRSGQLSRETYDQFKVEYDKFRLETSNQLQAISTRSITWTAAIGLIVVVLAAAFRFWKP
jgi:hypothetical protein